MLDKRVEICGAKRAKAKMNGKTGLAVDFLWGGAEIDVYQEDDRVSAFDHSHVTD